MRTKITHVEHRYQHFQHFAIETAEQNRANLIDKIVTGRPNAYVQSKGAMPQTNEKAGAVFAFDAAVHPSM